MPGGNTKVSSRTRAGAVAWRVSMVYLLLQLLRLRDIEFFFHHTTSASNAPAISKSSLSTTHDQQNTIYQSSSLSSSDRENLCVLIRTYIGHGLALPRQIMGWAISAQGLGPRDPIQHVSVYAINTHFRQNREDDERIVKLMDHTVVFLNDDDPQLDLHFVPLPDSFLPEKEKYGYDVTNYLLNLTLQPAHRKQCDRYIITNGDNTYHSDLLRAINNEILKHDADLIGFDFTTHHLRNGLRNTRVDAAFKRGHIDLGAVVIRKYAITNLCAPAPLLFSFEIGPFAADWAFFNNLIQCNATIAMVKQVLLHHH